GELVALLEAEPQPLGLDSADTPGRRLSRVIAGHDAERAGVGGRAPPLAFRVAHVADLPGRPAAEHRLAQLLPQRREERAHEALEASAELLWAHPIHAVTLRCRWHRW